METKNERRTKTRRSETREPKQTKGPAKYTGAHWALTEPESAPSAGPWPRSKPGRWVCLPELASARSWFCYKVWAMLLSLGAEELPSQLDVRSKTGPWADLGCNLRSRGELDAATLGKFHLTLVIPLTSALKSWIAIYLLFQCSFQCVHFQLLFTKAGLICCLLLLSLASHLCNFSIGSRKTQIFVTSGSLQERTVGTKGWLHLNRRVVRPGLLSACLWKYSETCP